MQNHSYERSTTPTFLSKQLESDFIGRNIKHSHIIDEIGMVTNKKQSRIEMVKESIIKIYTLNHEKRRSLHLMKAFYRWAYELPVTMKCDELWKQLRERNRIADDLRSAYLRDVITVKTFIDKIVQTSEGSRAAQTNAAVPSSSSTAEHNRLMDTAIKYKDEVQLIPTIDLRQLIDDAKQSFYFSSQQMQDTLTEAGLIDPDSEKTLNAWEKSKGFRRIMRNKTTPSFQYPDVGGQSIPLFAPARKNLFIRYCDKCIGVMRLVKSWNEEIESAMKFKADHKIIDGQLVELKNLVMNLNGAVLEREEEIQRLHGQNNELQVASAWFLKWSAMKDR